MRALLVAAVLGLGTAVVFGAAALTATLFPTGATVPAGWGGSGWGVKGGDIAVPAPVPVPVPAIEPGLGVDDGIAVPDANFQPLPGDTVTVDGNGVILEAVPER